MKMCWNNIKLIVSDFDGVMTDNRVMVDEDGRESVVVSRADGQAVHLLRSMGIELVIMSTETNGVVGQRAKKLGVECVQSVSDKADCLRQYCDEKQISMKHIAYVGNDVNDYGALQLAGTKIVPQDAYDEVKKIADYVTETKGGYGVIREIAEIIRNSKTM
jgi:YrbI family 3-deoxy-D-manno-octulosonate 8-phosphate phosphatase